MGKYQINGHSVLTVNKRESQDGKTWNSVGEDRATKQHPHGINEGDSHHIPKFVSGVPAPQTTPEETNTAIASLEEHVEQMKRSQQYQPPVQQANQPPVQYQQPPQQSAGQSTAQQVFQDDNDDDSKPDTL